MDKSEYKVSVIIPVYNATRTLERSFETVKNQTIGFSDIELLFCDDCSTDDTFDRISLLAKEYPNVKAFKTKSNNRYGGAARNVCLDNATAKYVMFLDADDVYTPDAVKTLYDEIEKSGVDVVSGYFSAATETKKGFRIEETITEQYDAIPDGEEYDLTAQWPALLPVCDSFWCNIYKNEIIEKNSVRFLEKCIAEDIYFLVHYNLCCKKGKYIKRHIYTYIRREGFFDNTADKAYYLNIPIHYEKIYELLNEKKRPELFKNLFWMEYYLHDYSVTKGFTEKDTEEIIRRWWELIKIAAKINMECTAPVIRFLVRDAKEDNFDDAVFHMEAFRALESEKRRQLDDIFGSTTWRLASTLQKLIFWK